MAVNDFEAFLRERAAIFDPNLDLNLGSPFDKQVIQPMVRRLGTDPFTVDTVTFMTARLQQAYPDMALDEGDALTDLVIKADQLLLDPIVREVDRVRKGLSFNDPSTLTTDEADALGANLFAERPQGKFARGVARIYFSQAQNVNVTSANIITAAGGLLFFPTEQQSIRVEEMLLNLGGDGRYYFDINIIAENPGSQYNLSPNSLSSIANLDAAVQITNLRRLEEGEDEQSAAEFVEDARQQLSERSLVTQRGISAKLTQSFPEITRLNSVGFNDPEMQRDILRGGSLGEILAAGVGGYTVNDAQLGGLTARFSATDPEVSFTSLIGPTGPASGYVLTVFGAGGALTVVQDLEVAAVIADDTVDVSEAVMLVGATDLRWTLRKRELILSDIPGGIIFPDGPNGTVTVPDGEIHIGGAVDVYTRGSSRDESTLVIDSLADSDPELQGIEFDFDNGDATAGYLNDYVLGNDYAVDDETYFLLERAARDALSLQILDGVNAGSFRILSVEQTSGQPPRIVVSPGFTSAVEPSARWRIFDAVDVALSDIRDVRIEGGDLITVQNSAFVKTVGSTNFDELGVAKGDTLRIRTGNSQGEYQVISDPLPPAFTVLELDQALGFSASNISYEIFRANIAGNVDLPLVRVSTIELLDSSSQPLGTTVPYAHPVDIQSRAFQNAARGVKYQPTDGRLGIVTPYEIGAFDVGGKTLNFIGKDMFSQLGTPIASVTFSAGPPKTAQEVCDEVNAVLDVLGYTSVCVVLGSEDSQVGIRPFTADGFVAVYGDAILDLFGVDEIHTTDDLRSSEILTESSGGGWWALSNPTLDLRTGLDVFQVVDGTQVGILSGPYVRPDQDSSTIAAFYGHQPSTALTQDADANFRLSPESDVTIKVGARSIGSVRCFFLEPTSFEAKAEEAFFTLDTGTGLLRFTPDPTLDYQRIPAQPSGTKPSDGASDNAGNELTSTSQDFIRSGIQPGDVVTIDYIPLTGTVVLPDPVPAQGLTLILSVSGSADITIKFLTDDPSIDPLTEVTRDGIVDQINAAVGINIARLTSSDTLQFLAEVQVQVRDTGTANSVILGNVAEAPSKSFSTGTQSNLSPHRGTYDIVTVNLNSLIIDGTFLTDVAYGSGLTDQQFSVSRAGVQRISTTQMADNEGEAGLYYFDLELVSEGTGDEYNIASDQQLTGEGYRSDGYYLTTEDSSLTFSPAELPHMVISKSILEPGVDDDPVNATQLVGQNLQVTYERSSLVNDVNNYISSEVERTVNASPLSKHLVPHFVRFDLTYTGGSSEEVVVPDLEEYIENLSPVEALESSDLQEIVSGRGATSIENPLDLIAIVHNTDRTVTAARSQNRLSTGRLAAFIPDILNVVRNVG